MAAAVSRFRATQIAANDLRCSEDEAAGGKGAGGKALAGKGVPSGEALSCASAARGTTPTVAAPAASDTDPSHVRMRTACMRR